MNMGTEQHKRKHEAIKVAQSLLGHPLNESWVIAKSHGLRLKVKSLDGETICRDSDNEGHNVSVVVVEGTIRKAWIE